MRVYYDKKEHIQFNTMYVCTLKVVKDRHGLQKQPEDAGIADFGFLGSQNSASMERGAEVARGWRWRMVAVTHRVRRATRNVLYSFSS